MKRVAVGLGILVVALLVAAILFPVFAKARVGSGRGITVRRLAYCAAQKHEETNVWPTHLEKDEACFTRRNPKDLTVLKDSHQFLSHR